MSSDMASIAVNPLLAWAITPLFFWAGLAAMGIPILIHILNRRRFKTVTWAAMEYLLAALRKNRRRLKFEQWVLLATRCAILLLLGLALARPLGCSDSTIAALAGSRVGMHVFVIDNSYSMAYEADRPTGKTHLDQAKFLAKQQIDQLVAGGESVVVITAGRTAQGDEKILLRPSYDLDAAKSAIDRIEQSYGATDLLNAMQTAARLAREESKSPHKYLYVLTDFTRSAWENKRDAEALRQTGRELAEAFGSRIRVHDLAKAGQWNYAALDLRPDGNLVTTKFHTDFLADVKGYGAGPDSLVQWMWNDQLLGDGGKIKPELNTEIQRQTKARVSDGGAHVLSVSLVNDERLKVDNTRWRVIEVAAELPVLIVEGERGSGLLSGSGAFLDLALAPRKEVGPGGKIRTDSYVAPELISDLELGNKVFGDYRAVILCNVAGLSAAQAEQVKRFVQQGGTLMIFMGEQVNADVYNSAMLPRGLMPGRLVARKTVAGDAKGFTLDFKPASPHKLLDVFRNQEKSGLDTAQIHTYFQLEVSPDAKADVVLKYLAGDKETNDPAIVVHGLGNGRVVTVTTTANPDWTSLPPKPAYPALVHELLSGTVNVGDGWMNLEAGQPLVVPGALRLTRVPVLTDADKKQIPLDAATGDGGTVYRSKPLAKPGLYHLNTGAVTLPVAVNVPADEADLRVLPPEAVKKAMGDIDVQLVTDALPDSALVKDEGTDLGWIVMVLLLGLVGMECVMAMRFGHYRRR